MHEQRFIIDKPMSLFGNRTQLQIRALLLGARVSANANESFRRIAEGPLTFAHRDGGCVVLFRYGAVVLIGMSAETEQRLIESLSIREPLAKPESEVVELWIDGDVQAGPRIEEGVIFVPDENIARLQVIAEALAKSVVLAHYENTIAATFDSIEPLAQNLNDNGRADKRVRELLEHMGSALLSEQRMVGRVEVREKPEALWEDEELARFYPRLEREYELRERATSLERKLDLISRTARTALDLLQQRRNLRVEWYIVALIVVEILLTLYGMLASHA